MRLIRDGWNVRALTRNPQSTKAMRLAAFGAEVVAANLDDARVVSMACSGAYAVFSVQDFWEHGYEREVLQGITLANAASAAGVAHFIYASVGGADRTQGLGIRHFDSKAEIERHVIASGLTYTIIRPVTFCENFTMPLALMRLWEQNFVSFPFPAGRPFQFLAIEDEADFIARILPDRERFSGMSIELASDECKLEDFAREIGRAIGRDIELRETTMERFAELTEQMERDGLTPKTKIGRSLVAQFNWIRSSSTAGWNADLSQIRGFLPTLRSMQEWVQSVDWARTLEVTKTARP
jgi:uncharacterized protein YbjT (DUF2867 family)